MMLLEYSYENHQPIDHIATNTPEKISDSGVIHTGISDHSLVFAIRKMSVIGI